MSYIVQCIYMYCIINLLHLKGDFNYFDLTLLWFNTKAKVICDYCYFIVHAGMHQHNASYIKTIIRLISIKGRLNRK